MERRKTDMTGPAAFPIIVEKPPITPKSAANHHDEGICLISFFRRSFHTITASPPSMQIAMRILKSLPGTKRSTARARTKPAAAQGRRRTMYFQSAFRRYQITARISPKQSMGRMTPVDSFAPKIMAITGMITVVMPAIPVLERPMHRAAKTTAPVCQGERVKPVRAEISIGSGLPAIRFRR
jgi:hypothetical protein